MFHPTQLKRPVVTLAVTIGTMILTLFAVPAAQAACTAAPTTKVFAAFGDSSDYSLAPGGSFESGATDWTLTGASVVTDNDPWKLHGAGDTKSLSVSAGGQAVSPAFCVGVEHPTFRFVARRTGGSWGVLNVKLRWKLAGGATNETVVTAIDGKDASWHVTDRSALSTVLPLWNSGQTASVQFVFDPEDFGGAWTIDDVYVDPYTRG